MRHKAFSLAFTALYTAALALSANPLAADICETDQTVVNINAASAEELRALPGIGEVISKRIVEHRGAEGPFSSVEAIMEVKGIGTAKFCRIRSRIEVGAQASEARPKPPRKVDLNSAGAGALQALEGVGPVLAARIIAFREGLEAGPDGRPTADKGFKPGPFTSTMQLVNVAGLSERDWFDNFDLVCVGDGCK